MPLSQAPRAAGGDIYGSRCRAAVVDTKCQGCPFPLLDFCPASAQLRTPSGMAHFIFQLHEGPLQKRVKKRESEGEKERD